MNEFSVFITVISSIIAITAVTLCSILSSYISQHGAKKVKQLELIFHEMVSAYYDYLKASDCFSDPHDIYQITVYSNAFDHAALFASPKTHALMTEHKQLVIKTLLAKGNQPDQIVNDLALEAAKVQADLVQSMRRDIKK